MRKIIQKIGIGVTVLGAAIYLLATIRSAEHARQLTAAINRMAEALKREFGNGDEAETKSTRDTD